MWGPTRAQIGYEGRLDLGNFEKGDGARLPGRGLIQITDRSNTEEAWLSIHPQMTLDAFCRWLESVESAAISAAWWWQSRGLNELANRGRFDATTQKITGGQNGAEDRRARWRKAKTALGVDINEKTPLG